MARGLSPDSELLRGAPGASEQLNMGGMGGHTQSPSTQHAAPECDHLRGRPRIPEMVDGGLMCLNSPPLKRPTRRGG